MNAGYDAASEKPIADIFRAFRTFRGQCVTSSCCAAAQFATAATGTGHQNRSRAQTRCATGQSSARL